MKAINNLSLFNTGSWCPWRDTLTLLSHDILYHVYTPLNPRAGQTNQLHYWSSIVYLAACGETLNIDFTLPFNEFVPTTCHTRFSLKVSHALSEYDLFQKQMSIFHLSVIVQFPLSCGKQMYECTYCVFSCWFEAYFWGFRCSSIHQ